MWMPVYIDLSKMIPEDSEISITAIIKTLQAASGQVYGRLLTVGLVVLSNKMGISKDPNANISGEVPSVLFVLCIALVLAVLQFPLLKLIATNIEVQDAQSAV